MIIGDGGFGNSDDDIRMDDVIGTDVRQGKHAADAGGHHLFAFPHQTEDQITIELGQVGRPLDKLIHHFKFGSTGKGHDRIFGDILCKIILHSSNSILSIVSLTPFAGRSRSDSLYAALPSCKFFHTHLVT